MKNRTLVLGAVVVSLITAIVGTFIFLDRSAWGKQKPIKKYSEVPEVISNVKTLEIVAVNLKEEGTTDAFVEIKIKNNSDKPVVAINLESGDDINAAGKMEGGSLDDNETSLALIQPYETFQTIFGLSNIIPGCPIRIAGVIYADGGEDGEEDVLKSMQRKIKHSKDQKTEGSPQ